MIAVIGAGAAGLMAAIHAARAGAQVVLLERTKDGGRKILISGGGRCNILPSRLDETRFVTDSSPNTLRKMLRSWPLAEQVAWFERELGQRLVEEEESAKLFPASNKARDVRDGLVRAATKAGVQWRPDSMVPEIAPSGSGWSVSVEGGEALRVEAVVVATGGLSVPTTGSDGKGLAILKQLGHTIHPTYPALTPVTASPGIFHELAGISLPVTLTARSPARSATAQGGFLFTHRGYSGPSVLNISHVLVRAREAGTPAQLRIRWADMDAAAWESVFRPEGTRTIGATVRRVIPERLANALMQSAAVDPARTLAQLRRDERVCLTATLVDFELPWTGDEGYKKAEVTGGGVALSEIHPATMESRRHPHLFICGEALDAFGPIGGYNFCWAWATGKAAGLAAAAKSRGHG